MCQVPPQSLPATQEDPPARGEAVTQAQGLQVVPGL